MSKLSQLACKIIEKRLELSDAQIPIVSRLLFDMAMVDAEAADCILEKRHRLNQGFATIVTEEELLQFMINYPHLSQKLFTACALPLSLAKKLVRATPRANASSQPDPEALLYEKARALFTDRTLLVIQRNPHIEPKHSSSKHPVDAEGVPLVTRYTRQFNQRLRSMGGKGRETIELDPDAPRLKHCYGILKNHLRPSMNNTEKVLNFVMRVTNAALPGTMVDSLVLLAKIEKKPIKLNEFMKQRVGVCRHHCLLNAYLLSRLVEDGILSGEVIHHRQSFKEGAHTWNLFRDNKTGLLYSLDSLWKNVTILHNKPGALDLLYQTPVEEKIFNRYGPAVMPPAEAASSSDQEALFQSKLDALKQRIEQTEFKLKTIFFNFKSGSEIHLADGVVKQVPDKIAELYHLIQNPEKPPSERWQAIQQMACQAQREDLAEDVVEFLRETIELQVASSSSSIAGPSQP